MQTKYLLDANIFIESHNLHYHPSFCEGFWGWIVLGYEAGIFSSIDKVKDELLHGGDDLSARISGGKIPGEFFIPSLSDPNIVQSYGRLMNWIATSKYSPNAIKGYQAHNTADPFLVAAAMTYNYVIVTKEKPAPLSITKIKIPDVAAANSVQCITLQQLLRDHAHDNFKLKPKSP